MYSSIKIKFLN